MVCSANEPVGGGNRYKLVVHESPERGSEGPPRLHMFLYFSLVSLVVDRTN
jgi:hypothetical protein